MTWDIALGILISAYVGISVAIVAAIVYEACDPPRKRKPSKPRSKAMLGRRSGYDWKRRTDGTYHLIPRS